MFPSISNEFYVISGNSNDFLIFSEFYKPRRPRSYYQRRRERVRKQAEREAERLELESMQVHNEFSDSDSSEEDEDDFDFEYENEQDDGIENLEIFDDDENFERDD